MELHEAISNGFLCPLQFNIVSTFSPSTAYITDSIKAKREHLLYNGNVADLASKIGYASHVSLNESSLILVEELTQINMLQARLNKLGIPFTYAHSASKKVAQENNLKVVDNQEEVFRFNNAEVPILIGTSCISTGTNIYPTHNVINLVGGSSEIVTKQGTMGRATRLLEKSKFAHLHKPKPFSKIWDFDIRNQKILENQLKTRIKFYQEAGGVIKYVNL
jgi:superfamily II DNA or RNA helicase